MESDGDDISLLSLTDEEEAPAAGGAAREAFRPSVVAKSKNPTSWAQVDESELDRVALRIASQALPLHETSPDTAPAGAAASASPASEASEDCLDPLGFGPVDARQLSLVSRPSQVLPGAQGEVAPQLRARVLPWSPQFEPELYLGIVHRSTPIGDLALGLDRLETLLGEHSQQLKRLIRDNFGAVVSSKTAVDDVFERLRRTEGGDTIGGASSADILAAVQALQAQAARSFGALVERAARADRIRRVLGLVDAYADLVGGPARIQAAAHAGDYALVCAHYRRAAAELRARREAAGAGREEEAREAEEGRSGPSTALVRRQATRTLLGGESRLASQLPLRGAGEEAPVSAWDVLQDGLDGAVHGAIVALELSLRDPASDPDAILAALKALCALRAAGAPGVQGPHPLEVWVQAQTADCEMAFASAEAEQQAALSRTSASPLGLAPLPSLGSTPLASLASAPVAPLPPIIVPVVASSAALECLLRQAHALSDWLPGFDSATGLRLEELQASDEGGADRADVDRGRAEARRVQAALLRRFEARARAALEDAGEARFGWAELVDAAGELATVAGRLRAALEVRRREEAWVLGTGQGAEAESAAGAASSFLPAAVQSFQSLCLLAADGALDRAAEELDRAACAALDSALDSALRSDRAPSDRRRLSTPGDAAAPVGEGLSGSLAAAAPKDALLAFALRLAEVSSLGLERVRDLGQRLGEGRFDAWSRPGARACLAAPFAAVARRAAELAERRLEGFAPAPEEGGGESRVPASSRLLPESSARPARHTPRGRPFSPGSSPSARAGTLLALHGALRQLRAALLPDALRRWQTVAGARGGRGAAASAPLEEAEAALAGEALDAAGHACAMAYLSLRQVSLTHALGQLAAPAAGGYGPDGASRAREAQALQSAAAGALPSGRPRAPGAAPGALALQLLGTAAELEREAPETRAEAMEELGLRLWEALLDLVQGAPVGQGDGARELRFAVDAAAAGSLLARLAGEEGREQVRALEELLRSRLAGGVGCRELAGWAGRGDSLDAGQAAAWAVHRAFEMAAQDQAQQRFLLRSLGG